MIHEDKFRLKQRHPGKIRENGIDLACGKKNRVLIVFEVSPGDCAAKINGPPNIVFDDQKPFCKKVSGLPKTFY